MFRLQKELSYINSNNVFQEEELNKLKNEPERSVGFMVDGKLINELSKQVSSHIFALGELLKNSYDAKSTKIDIKFNKKERLLVIEDNGTGISSKDFSSLLHIAKSSKEYGQQFSFNKDKETITRYTQGSKGLGLFCAFKFGDLVIWDTKFKNESSKLVVDKNKVIEQADISKIVLPISDGSREKTGTTITITIDPNDNDINYIYDFFKSSKNSRKITRYFFGNDVEISIDLIDENGSRESGFPKKTQSKQHLNNEHIDKKVFDISYDSEKNEIIYRYIDGRTKTISYKLTHTLKDFRVNLHINAYQLQSGGVNKINNIFHNNRDELSPLVYINGVMFNSDQFFDPSITRKVSSKQALPQLTGFIQVICTNNQLQFNNERTDLIRNSYNEEIRQNINNLNKEIQSHGKNIIREFGPSSLPPGQFPLLEPSVVDEFSTSTPSSTPTTPSSTPTTPVSTSTNTDEKPIINDGAAIYIKPYIKLEKNKVVIRFFDESDTINIYDYLEEAKDSRGNDVPIDKISISINGKVVSNKYIESIDSTQDLKVKFSFTDEFELNYDNNPLKVSKSLSIEFIKENKNFGVVDESSAPLITTIGDPGYRITLKGVNKLISQINLLAKDYEEYDMCIAASIRIVFDLTTYIYQQFTEKTFSNNSLEVQVKEIIEHIISNNQHYSKVSNLIGPRHRIAKNIFVPGLFEQRVTLSNLGSHTGSVHMSKEDIRDIAKYAGYYAQIVDAHLKVEGFIDQ